MQIQVQRNGFVATIVIDNIAKRNAMNQAMWISLGDAVLELSRDPQLRCVVLRGKGEAAFGSGADIEEFSRLRADKEQALAFGRHGHRAMHAVRDCPVPTIAAIRGICVGGGLELAAMCDLRICSDDSRFGVPISRLGATLAYPELEGLVRAVGPEVALELLLEGRLFGAQEAYEKRLVSRVVPVDQFEEALVCTVGRITAQAPLCSRWHKKFVARLRNTAPLSDTELAEGYACFDTEDYQIGYQAFLDKKTPEFIGR